jgi:hypothetical protein
LESTAFFTGTLYRVRVIASKREQQKIPVQFFYGRIEDLTIDPARIIWSDNVGLFTLRKRHLIEDLATRKWHMILPPKFKFAWDDTWKTQRARKEAMLIWQMWYKAVVVNVWKGHIFV